METGRLAAGTDRKLTINISLRYRGDELRGAELCSYLRKRWGCVCLSCSDWWRPAGCWAVPGWSAAAERLRLLQDTNIPELTHLCSWTRSSSDQ